MNVQREYLLKQANKTNNRANCSDFLKISVPRPLSQEWHAKTTETKRYLLDLPDPQRIRKDCGREFAVGADRGPG